MVACPGAIPSHSRISWGHCAADLRIEKAQSFQRLNFAVKLLNFANGSKADLLRGILRAFLRGSLGDGKFE
jgi:hypothetical protein